MKRFLVLSALLLPLGASAAEAEGFYAGLQLGYAQAEDDGTSYDRGTGMKNGWAQENNPRGGLYGVFGGYNWSLGNGLLLGVEADVEARADDRDSTAQLLNGVDIGDFEVTTKIRSAASVRGRLGMLVTPQAQLYVTAGYGLVDVQREYKDFAGARDDAASRWQDGWVAGIGAEYQLSAALAGRIEYRYADYGSEDLDVQMWGERYEQDLTEKTLRMAAVYRF